MHLTPRKKETGSMRPGAFVSTKEGFWKGPQAVNNFSTLISSSSLFIPSTPLSLSLSFSLPGAHSHTGTLLITWDKRSRAEAMRRERGAERRDATPWQRPPVCQRVQELMLPIWPRLSSPNVSLGTPALALINLPSSASQRTTFPWGDPRRGRGVGMGYFGEGGGGTISIRHKQYGTSGLVMGKEEDGGWGGRVGLLNVIKTFLRL